MECPDEFLGFEGTNFGVGVTNLFDTDPPALTARPLFDQEVHDPRGRQIFLWGPMWPHLL